MSDSIKRPTPHFLSELSQTLSLRNDRLFFAIAIISIAPLWIGPYLPSIDIPQHAAQIAALREMWSDNETFTQAFHINWFTPYLLGYLLLYLVALVLPVTAATQVLVSLAVVSVPLLTARLLRAAGADERWRWLAIPCSFSFAFYWGFLSFIVAVPFALLFLIATVRFVRAPTLGRAVGIALFSIFLFFCHVIVLGFASLAALGYVVGSNYRNMKELALRALPYAAPVPLIGIWLAITYQSEAIVRSDPIVFAPLAYRLMQLLVQPSGREAFSPYIVVLVSASVVLLPWLAGSRLSRRPERWLPFALGLLVFLLSPHYVLSTAFFFQRLGIFLVPLWLLAWDPPSAPPRRLDWVAMLVVVLWMFTSIGRFAAFARETHSFGRIMSAAEPGHKVAAMVFDNSSPLFALPVYLHFPAWYQATHRGIVDFNFADFYSQMVRYGSDAAPRITEPLAWRPTAFKWDENGGADYEYFLVKANFDISNEIFKEQRRSVELVARSDWWWLYRNVERRHSLSGQAQAKQAQ